MYDHKVLPRLSPLVIKEKRNTLRKKLPIGIQSFEKLRTDQFLYVDKTDYVYQLVHNNVPYFLSRPRRFEKAYFCLP